MCSSQLSPVYAFWNPSSWKDAPHNWICPPFSVNLVKKIPHRCDERHAPWVILGLGQLTVSINCPWVYAIPVMSELERCLGDW